MSLSDKNDFTVPEMKVTPDQGTEISHESKLFPDGRI